MEHAGEQDVADDDEHKHVDDVPVLLLVAVARSSFVTASATSKVSVSNDAIRSLSSDT